jgi:hypothetical protein
MESGCVTQFERTRKGIVTPDTSTPHLRLPADRPPLVDPLQYKRSLIDRPVDLNCFAMSGFLIRSTQW